MDLIDRRFLDLGITVQSVANEPSGTPTEGTQYIVGSAPTGEFANASANQIARYDGSIWKFSKPVKTQLEVLNLDTGEFLKYNGTAWSSVASIGSSSDSNASNVVIFDDFVLTGDTTYPNGDNAQDGIPSGGVTEFNQLYYKPNQLNNDICGRFKKWGYSSGYSKEIWTDFSGTGGNGDYYMEAYNDGHYNLHIGDVLLSSNDGNMYILAEKAYTLEVKPLGDEPFVCFSPKLNNWYQYRPSTKDFVKIGDKPIGAVNFACTADNSTALNRIEASNSFNAIGFSKDKGQYFEIKANSDGTKYWSPVSQKYIPIGRYISYNEKKIYTVTKAYVSGVSSFEYTSEDISTYEPFLNKGDNCQYIYDGTDFIKISGVMEAVVEPHTLTSSEVSAKSFTLANNIKSGQTANILLFVKGIIQVPETDFTASGNTISWSSRGLDNFGLSAGDTFMLHYIKA